MPKHPRPLPPLDEIRKRFHYDPDTGELTNKKTGKPVRGGRQSRYYQVWITLEGQKSQKFWVHRICWALANNQDPYPWSIDHIDCDRKNNRASNLRLCDQTQNAANGKLRSDNTSGAKGVSWDKSKQKWEWYVDVKGKRVARGRTNTFEEAQVLAKIARTRLHGEFARHD